MLEPAAIIGAYHQVSPNLFLPDVVEAFRLADEETWAGTPRTARAKSLGKIYRWALKGRLPLSPRPLREAVQRAVLDAADAILQEKKSPFSARFPVYTTTGRVADQSGLARRTIQELFAERHVPRMNIPQEGEIWLVKEAEDTLAAAGWVLREGKPVRGKPGSRILLLGGGQYHRAVTCVEAFDPQVEEVFREAHLQGKAVPSLVTEGYGRLRQDWMALGVIYSRGTGFHWTSPLLRTMGRKALKGSQLVPNWQSMVERILPWDPLPGLFQRPQRGVDRNIKIF